MNNKRTLDYEIKIQGYEPIKGSIKANPNESLTSIRQKIQKQAGFRQNTICIEQPNGSFLQQGTKMVVLRQIKSKLPLRKLSSQGSIVFQEESIIERSISQEYMYQEPEIPARVVGQVKRCYPIFSCMSSTRVMVLNYEAVCFAYNQTDLQNPERVIELKDIKQVSSYRKQSYYFLRIITNQGQRIDFKFQNKQVCRQWIGYFNKALDYWDFLSQKRNYSRADSYRNFIKTLQQKDKSKIVKLQQSTFVADDENKQPCKQRNTIVKSNSKIIRLADFKVTMEIGKGAFSTVYKAQRNGKVYALKQINKDKLIYENQLKYAIAQLNILKKCSNKCPFIIPISCAFQTEDYLYLAIKYLPFGTLKSVIQKRKQLTLKQAVGIICQLIVAIEFLHKNNILYRDMKPENILLTQEGHIYLIDFGLSIELNDQQQFAESFVGTPLYLAPQRLEGSGKINYKADIYGVGCIFYLLLHGHAPFQADTLASIIFSIKNCQLKIREDLDDLAQDFLKNTLQTSVQKRLNHMSSHPLFEKVDWNKVIRKQNQIMSLDMKDSCQLTSCNSIGDHDYTELNYPNKKINDWNYIEPTQQRNSRK